VGERTSLALPAEWGDLFVEGEEEELPAEVGEEYDVVGFERGYDQLDGCRHPLGHRP